MKKVLFFLYSFFLLIMTASALEVDKQEIIRDENKTVEFINYSGKYDQVDSVRAIRSIGEALAPAVRTGVAGDPRRYYMVHAVDPNESGKFDADILVLGSAVKVDHINNLRLILSGYLSSAYGYSEQDAKTLAFFITVYNAVYRNDIAVFKERYKNIVLTHLNDQKVGLALRYDQWPGQAEIVIPLIDQTKTGTISTINTSLISDKKVVEKLREDPDRNLSERKELITFKERERDAAEDRATQAKQRLSEQQSILEGAKKNVEIARQRTQEQERRVAEQERIVKQAEANLAKEPNNPQLRETVIQARTQLEREKVNLEERKVAQVVATGAVADAENTIRTTKTYIRNEQDFARQKNAEAQRDRIGVATDTQIIQGTVPDTTGQFRGYGLKVSDDSQFLSEIVLIDLRTEKVIARSPIKTVRGRNLYKDGSVLVAVAGLADKRIALVQLHPTTLEVIKTSEQTLSGESVLVKHGGSYYAVIQEGGRYYVGRFSPQLTLQSQSELEVLPYTAITVADTGLIVQDAQSKMKLIQPVTLTTILP